MNLNKILQLSFLVLFSTGIYSQNVVEAKTEKKFDVGLEGMIGISFNHKTIGVNVGGPSFKFRWNKNFKIGVGALPSLIVLDKRAYPRLGVSPIIEYKKYMLIAPYYGYDTADKMIWTLGFGYKFY
jgi:hypothetical protein